MATVVTFRSSSDVRTVHHETVQAGRAHAARILRNHRWLAGVFGMSRPRQIAGGMVRRYKLSGTDTLCLA